MAGRLARMAASYAFELYRTRRTATQLQQALNSRIIIEQAEGVLLAAARSRRSRSWPTRAAVP